jgi:hypothetical protein
LQSIVEGTTDLKRLLSLNRAVMEKLQNLQAKELKRVPIRIPLPNDRKVIERKKKGAARNINKN